MKKEIEFDIFIEQDGTINIVNFSETALKVLLALNPKSENLNKINKILKKNKIKGEVFCG